MEPFIGQIKLFPFSYAPKGWEKCEGQPLPTSDFWELFQVLGTKFGGDGINYFLLPDLRGKAPVDQGPFQPFPGYQYQYCIALKGLKPLKNEDSW